MYRLVTVYDVTDKQTADWLKCINYFKKQVKLQFLLETTVW